MSKFLKFIVHFIVIATIICILGLALPQFFGITTVVMDDSEKMTNLPMGSVTYAIPVKTEEIGAGAPILVQEDGRTYRYNVATLDFENHTGTVVDPTVSGAETITVAVKNRVPKVVITIGLVGYLLAATKSIEGMIILGLAVLFLIILYVIAELWRKDKDDSDELDPQVSIKSERELKREEKAREQRMREEDRELLKSSKARKKEEKKKKKIIRTGGFVDEIDDEDEDTYAEEPVYDQQPVNMQAAATEAHELLKKEIAAATADEAGAFAEEPVQETVPVMHEEAELQEEPEPEEVKPAEIKKMAIPVWTAAQLADKAKKAGDAPDIVRDPITKVTLFDYSDIISGGPAEEDEE